MEAQEEWRDVVGFEGVYLVSNKGRVKRIKNHSGRKPEKIERILDPRVNRKGYKSITLSHAPQKVSRRVHRLVAIAFLGSPAKGLQVNHIDCDKANNYVENLEWVTSEQNHAHAKRNGLKASGERNASSKLTLVQARWIRKLATTGDWTLVDIAEKYGVSFSCIQGIVSGKAWRDAGGYPIRMRRGVGHYVYKGKFKESDIVKIRELYSSDEHTLESLGEDFGVHLSTIWQIVNRKTWKHVS